MTTPVISYVDDRVHRRFQVTADSLLFGQNAEQGVAASVKNISDGGMMVQTCKPVDTEENFMVLLLGNGKKDIVTTLAHVVWQQRDKDGSNHVGLQFTQSTDLSQWVGQ